MHNSRTLNLSHNESYNLNTNRIGLSDTTIDVGYWRLHELNGTPVHVM
jgi:hypothetical protein